MNDSRPTRSRPTLRLTAHAVIVLALLAFCLGMSRDVGAGDAYAGAPAAPTRCAAGDCLYLPVIAAGALATLDGAANATPALPATVTAPATATTSATHDPHGTPPPTPTVPPGTELTPTAPAGSTATALPTASASATATANAAVTATASATATALATLLPADVQIVQLRIRPGNMQFAELRNAGGQVAVLTGWTLSDADAPPNAYTFGPFALSAGASVRVWNGDGADTATDLYWNPGDAAIWNDAGDTAFLRNAEGMIVAQCAYQGPADIVRCQ